MNAVNQTNADEVARTVKGGAVIGPATVRRSASIKALAAAMLEAQRLMENPARTTDNAYFASKYADLAEVRAAVLPALLESGLVVVQLPCELDGSAALQTLLVHAESGEWLETTIRLRAGKDTPQAVGSAITYARRYALQALAGVAAEDDDGNEASRPAAPAAAPAAPAPLTGEQAEAVAGWKKYLDSRPGREALNLTLRGDLARAPGPVKAAAWELFRRYAGSNGWEYDRAEKGFVQMGNVKA